MAFSAIPIYWEWAFSAIPIYWDWAFSTVPIYWEWAFPMNGFWISPNTRDFWLNGLGPLCGGKALGLAAADWKDLQDWRR